jgi:hypothetical protein
MAVTGSTNVVGPFVGRLSNSGETLQLRNNSGRVVDEVTYGVDGDWPVAPDGSGVSLAKLDHDTASGPAGNWSFSDQIGGTPGAENFPEQNSVPAQVFAADTSWKFDASGTDLGSAWCQPGYSDAAWASGDGWLYCGTITNGLVQPVATLFDTGVDASGSVLTPGAADPHFILTAAAQGTVNANAAATITLPIFPSPGSFPSRFKSWRTSLWTTIFPTCCSTGRRWAFPVPVLRRSAGPSPSTAPPCPEPTPWNFSR